MAPSPSKVFLLARNSSFRSEHESSSGAQGALEVPGLTDGKGRFVKTLAEGEDLKLGELKVPTTDFKL